MLFMSNTTKVIDAMMNIPNCNISVSVDSTDIKASPFLESELYVLQSYAPPPFQDSHHLTYNAVTIVYHYSLYTPTPNIDADIV